VLVNDTITTVEPSPASHLDTTFNVEIGSLSGSNRFWKGMLDEVRISNVARSANWIKLSYMNQKADDALIETK
jgi:hypothetical protein